MNVSDMASTSRELCTTEEVSCVDSILEKPFSRRSIQEKLDIKRKGRETPTLKSSVSGTKRSFNAAYWYEKVSWLTGSVKRQKLFCWSCLLFPPSTGPDVWFRRGYDDWKNLDRATLRHSSNKEHLKSELQYKYLGAIRVEQSISEAARISIKQHNELVDKNREVLKRLTDITCWLALQGLPFRGHFEGEESKNKGNFMELFKLMVKYDSVLQIHLETSKTFKGTSKSIQNDLIQCVQSVFTRSLLADFESAPFLTVIMDEATDVSSHSQLAISFRYVNMRSGAIEETFWKFIDVSSGRDAESLFKVAVEILRPWLPKLIGLCFDGAAVMVGHHNGLRAKIQNVAPTALFVHCSAHRLNLVLSQSASSIKEVKIFFATLTGFSSFFSKSSKRMEFLENIVNHRLPRASETRWNFKSRLVKTVWEYYDILIELFQLILEQSNWDKDTTRDAKGYLNFLVNFENIILLAIFSKIFEKTEILFKILQTKASDTIYCSKKVTEFCELFQSWRSDDDFDGLYNTAKDKNSNVEPILQQRRSDETLTHYDLLRRLYFQILDNVIEQLKFRFSDMKQLGFMKLVEVSNFPAFSKTFPEEILNSLCDSVYGRFFNAHQLRNELEVIYAQQELRQESVSERIKEMIQISLIECFSEYFKLLCLIATYPITSASVERAFSVLKRTKSYLRNTIGQERLSALTLISIESEKLQELKKQVVFYDNVINEFASMKQRRMEFLYK